MVLNKSFQSFELFTKELVKNNFLLNSGIGSNYYNPLTNNKISLHLPQNHHLKLGRGWAWAGHISANWDAALVLNVEDSDFELNCGLVPPIGSNKNIFLILPILEWSLTECRLGKVLYLKNSMSNYLLSIASFPQNCTCMRAMELLQQIQWTTKILLKGYHQFWIRWHSG